MRVSPAARVTLPVRVGVVSLVTRAFTVGAAGGVVLTTSSPVVTSLMLLPKASLAVAVTG